tara:strand:+ start:99 stop:494 length:396 start_codon:yes stop_codon:yes gene_type:complete
MDALDQYLSQNLKVVSKIELNDKVCIRNGNIYIDQSWAPPIKRYLMGDGRDGSLEYITTLLNTAFVHVDHLILLNNESGCKDKLLRLTEDLSECSTGLGRLSETYSRDPSLKAQIEILLQNIKLYVDKGQT